MHTVFCLAIGGKIQPLLPIAISSVLELNLHLVAASDGWLRITCQISARVGFNHSSMKFSENALFVYYCQGFSPLCVCLYSALSTTGAEHKCTYIILLKSV